jgi:hypothetical protein
MLWHLVQITFDYNEQWLICDERLDGRDHALRPEEIGVKMLTARPSLSGGVGPLRANASVGHLRSAESPLTGGGD